MTLIPWGELDSADLGGFGEVARQARDAYCEVGDRVPVFRNLPLNAFIRRAACPSPAIPDGNQGQLGQCNAEYRVNGSILGVDVNGNPARDSVGTPISRVWGPLGEFRLVASSGFGTVALECFAFASRNSATRTWVRCATFRSEKFAGVGEFDKSLVDTFVIEDIRVTATNPDETDDLACYRDAPITDPIDVGQPIVEVEVNPTFQIDLPPIIAPVVVAPVVVAPRFDIELGDDNSVSMDFTLEGVVIDDSNTTIEVDVDNSQVLNEINNIENNLTQVIDNSSQVINNQTTTEVSNAKNEIINEFQTEVGDLALDLSTQVGGQIDVSIPTALDSYFETNPVEVEVDYDRIAELIDALPDNSIDIDNIFDLATEISLAINAELIPAVREVGEDLEDIQETLEDIEDELECLIEAQPGSWIFASTQTALDWTATPTDNVRALSVPGGCPFALIEVTGFETGAVRTYKFSGLESDMEAGFGHYCQLANAAALDFNLLARRRHGVLYSLDADPNVSPGLLISVKPGVSIRVTWFLYRFEPFVCIE